MLLFGDVKTGGMSRQGAHRGALNPTPVVGTLGSGEGTLRALLPSQRAGALVRDMPSRGLSELPACTPVAKLPAHLII